MNNLSIKKIFKKNDIKVKSVCLHSTLPWVLTTTYENDAMIYDYEKMSTVKTFDCNKEVVRIGIFNEEKGWVILGCDDKKIRIYNYYTLEKVVEEDIHEDFVRYIDIK